ncbi:uncharacterized protein LOC128897808 [Dryobates pubescens]|uniref:uncharacterized protein LOC128897808 n=1 Tax=Dryobates pubescens TaxID=118200 RepID=UPI0023B981A6|nr:uncharacterized protein LOC128897808 [Dryobates pubescens]
MGYLAAQGVENGQLLSTWAPLFLFLFSSSFYLLPFLLLSFLFSSFPPFPLSLFVPFLLSHFPSFPLSFFPPFPLSSSFFHCSLLPSSLPCFLSPSLPGGAHHTPCATLVMVPLSLWQRSLSSPTKAVPVPLGELLSWVSTVGRSWLCPRGATAAAGHSLAQAPSAAKDASVTRKSMEGSELDGEEMERTQQPGKCPERCSEVQEQLLALRHWLDAMEKQLPAQTEPGTVPQAGIRGGGTAPAASLAPSPVPWGIR